MKSIVILVLGVFCFSQNLKAQEPAELLNTWANATPIEKIYLHLDRENYIAGSVVWFKAYLYSDFYPDTISTSLYVELLSSRSTIILKKVFPVLFGNAKGQLELPDTLKSGNYFIRAYSPTMLNHSDEFLFQRSVSVYGKEASVDNINSSSIKVEFFPESGNFVADLPNTIAVKITDGSGMPVNRSGVVKNEKDETVAEFITYHDGMGMFDIKPGKDSKYYVQLNDDPVSVKYELPAISPSGLVFRLMPNPQGKYFEIYQSSEDVSRRASYMIGQMQHRVVFKMELDPDKKDINGYINTTQLKSGILQATVFNKDGIPLAERLSFIDNKEYIQKAELITDTVNFSERAKNYFTLSIPDTVGGSFSVSITDPEYSIESSRQNNIISSLILTGDLRGYIHNPVYYFSADQDSATNAMDLLMMINGWRRFKWAELPVISSKQPLYKDSGYITITGHVNIRDRKKPLANKELFLMRTSKEDSLNTSIEFMQTDDEGKFRMDSLIFFGTTRFYVSDMQGGKNKWLDIYPDNDSINMSFNLKPLTLNRFKPYTAGQSALQDDYDEILKANGQMLEGITVKAKKKTSLQELEERYASGMFSGLSEKTIDLVNSNEKIYQNNIFDYIQGRVPGIKVQKEGLNYTLFYRQRFSLMGGPIPMALYLNEMQTTSRIISTIPANQVAMIKVYSSFFGAEGNGVGGVLAVYTKQGADLSNALMTSADIFQYKGYSVIKEFYAPDYSVPSAKTDSSFKKDHRITLHWQPDILADGVDTKIPIVFYNNDRTKKFRVIVEGMTSEGKMLFIEKIIAPVQKGF
ncbi:MAG TPA: hypothetical protein PKC72_03180 [Chitinophagaceae bacterium]|nr:hypothetical protein [Chitinophagaceae bacterium]